MSSKKHVFLAPRQIIDTTTEGSESMDYSKIGCQMSGPFYFQAFIFLSSSFPHSLTDGLCCPLNLNNKVVTS